jgi:hypothetical protein
VSLGESVRISRDELFGAEVDQALARQRALTQRERPTTPPLPAWRRVLLSSLFYMPVAGWIGALIAWGLVEPRMVDLDRVGGEVVLVNEDPFDVSVEGAIALTVGDQEVIAFPGRTKLEAGSSGQPPFESMSEIETGTVLEVVGIEENDKTVAFGIRPAAQGEVSAPQSDLEQTLVGVIVFPLVSLLIGLGILLAEGVSTRNWRRTLERALLGGGLTAVFCLIAIIPAGLLMQLAEMILDEAANEWLITVRDLSSAGFLGFTACRSAAWAVLGAAAGFGMNAVRGTQAQLRNSTLGGALGGALGGLFFDPISRFIDDESVFVSATLSRIIGFSAVGLAIGLFVALVERLAREAWLLVRTGPLAGKSFVLYRTPTTLGSSPDAEVYLFKDPEVDGAHAALHRVGTTYEIEDLSSRTGTKVGSEPIRRRRLVSGDQIVLGSTIVEFVERAARPLESPAP